MISFVSSIIVKLQKTKIIKKREREIKTNIVHN